MSQKYPTYDMAGKQELVQKASLAFMASNIDQFVQSKTKNKFKTVSNSIKKKEAIV